MSNHKLNLQEVFFFIVLISTTLVFFFVIKPFLADIFMAILFVIIFKNPFAFFIKKFKGKKSKATLVTMTMVIFTIVIPLTFITIMISKEIGSTYVEFKGNWPVVKEYIANLPEKVSSIPLLEEMVGKIDWKSVANQAGDQISTLIEFTVTLVQKTFINAGFMVVHFFIVLFLLYYLFLDGDQLIKRLQYIIPLKDADEKEMYKKIEQVTDAIVINTFVSGCIEGTYGGILFALLGISSPFFWGMLMAFLSIIPLVGANTILLPMAIVQFILGDISAGLIILVLGCGVIIVNQNIIRPRLDGNRSGMHPALMFLSSMGGLILLGIIGFIAGPMILGLFLIIWNIFGERYKLKLEESNGR